MTDNITSREGPHELVLDLPAAHSAGRLARQMLCRFAAREGVPDGDVRTLEFVAGELIDNAVDHGGGGAAREVDEVNGNFRVSLRLRVAGDRWMVCVGDQGGGQPEDVRRFLDPEGGMPDLEDERGRGFFLLVQMVDEIGVVNTADGLGLQIEATCRYGGGA